jgi:rhamnulokinase/L-fuculokinase
MPTLNTLAIDIGASNVRGVLGCFDGNVVKLEELSRYDTVSVDFGVVQYWDFPRIFYDVQNIVSLASRVHGIQSFGIDSWGDTHCFLDASGRLLENPQCYRDPHLDDICEQAKKFLSLDDVTKVLGYRLGSKYRALLQTAYMTHYRKNFIAAVDSLLFLPATLNYYFSGFKYAEHSAAASPQWVPFDSLEWNTALLSLTGLDISILPEVVKSGSKIGRMRDSMCSSLGIISPPKIIAVCEHDTASAVSCLENDYGSIFISQGTWSVVGAVVSEPIFDSEAIGYGFQNEACYEPRVRFLKEHLGLWLLQQCRRDWRLAGHLYDYDALDSMALKAEPFKNVFNSDSPELFHSGNLTERIMRLCGSELSIEETARAIFESIAVRIAVSCRKIKQHCGRDFSKIRLVGGGGRSSVLNQFIADASGMVLEVGPFEGTCMGNIVSQLIAAGEIANIKEGEELINHSTQKQAYYPDSHDKWIPVLEQHGI